jgi:hypothetical protein
MRDVWSCHDIFFQWTFQPPRGSRVSAVLSLRVIGSLHDHGSYYYKANYKKSNNKSELIISRVQAKVMMIDGGISNPGNT